MNVFNRCWCQQWQVHPKEAIHFCWWEMKRQWYLVARGWDDPLQLQRRCFHLSTPRKDPLRSLPFLPLLSSSCSRSPPFQSRNSNLCRITVSEKKQPPFFWEFVVKRQDKVKPFTIRLFHSIFTSYQVGYNASKTRIHVWISLICLIQLSCKHCLCTHHQASPEKTDGSFQSMLCFTDSFRAFFYCCTWKSELIKAEL